MLKFEQSIRNKITLGYYLVGLLILGLSLFAFIELRYFEQKILSGETISEFFDTALEVRRFEKNYFLYRQEDDYVENIKYLLRAEALLETNLKKFASITEEDSLTRLRSDLKKYRELMDAYHRKIRNRNPDETLTVLESGIRKTGKDITSIAEDLAKTERRHLQSVLDTARKSFIFSILALVIIGVVIGQVLSRMVVRPLKLIENSLTAIADGSFEKIVINSRDREIISLANAFNKMLGELEIRQRHLVQSEKLASLGTLLSGVAHELNNPLSNISTSAQILIEEIDGADMEYKKELLLQVEEQTDRARNIVRSLLDYSRDRKFNKEKLPVRDILDETVQFIKGQIPTKVEINISVPENLSINADKQRIQQVFLNLFKNAVEAVGDNGRITVIASKNKGGQNLHPDLKFCGKCNSKEDSIDIEISDTGCGIPADTLPKIFDPFFSTKDVGKGSGLGLFIVFEIMEEHDGCVGVKSTAGTGTTFLLRLPDAN
ncbi:MAG: HAMP domain-containing histidine kinase [Nitrospirae bacterium]|nr:MAG: HAMP domain-containing histidine kinase [Nitrospirota bacterium]